MPLSSARLGPPPSTDAPPRTRSLPSPDYYDNLLLEKVKLLLHVNTRTPLPLSPPLRSSPPPLSLLSVSKR